MKHLIFLFAMAITANADAQGIGIKMENMNLSINPGNDFYLYANEGWMKANPLKPEYSRFGSFDVVGEKNKEQIKELILGLSTEKHEKGSVAQKVGDLYTIYMDSTRQNAEGVKPILNDLKAIENVQDRQEALRLMVDNVFKGGSSLWGEYIGADMMDSKNNLVEIYQGGLTLGQKEYYLSEEESFKKIREAFKVHIVKMFQLVGDDEATATRKMESVMDIETRMAKASKSRTELRDPASNYHKMNYDEFKKEYNNYDWDYFFKTHFIENLQELSVGQPEALKEAVAILNDTPLRQVKDWMQWNLLDTNASNLGDEVYLQNFDFYSRTMSGTQEPQPRWKRSVNGVSGVLGEAVGEMYVAKYFPPQNKERMEKLVRNLQLALAERIDAQEWMSEATKKYAKEKLSTFYVKIGYPDKWKDYSQLDIDPAKNRYQTSQDIRRWAIKKQVEEKYNKPVDRDEWHMTPQTVNAYYNPTTNEICFPAGILQYPFFDMEADDAFNYGAIGVVIGHEMTHGFDDQGRQFDKDGNFKDWWQEGDGDKFKAIAKGMADFFSNIEVLPGLNGNGELTLGENLADHGGLQVAYAAFINAQKQAEKEGKQPLQTINGLTPSQRFFIAYAGVWGQNITEEEIRKRTVNDPHALGRWRVNGALPHIDAWYNAFNIQTNDKLYIPKDKRVNIW